MERRFRIYVKFSHGEDFKVYFANAKNIRRKLMYAEKMAERKVVQQEIGYAIIYIDGRQWTRLSLLVHPADGRTLEFARNSRIHGFQHIDDIINEISDNSTIKTDEEIIEEKSNEQKTGRPPTHGP